MTLPDDYARCRGVPDHGGCYGCLRREPVSERAVYYTQIAPAIFGNGHCQNKIQRQDDQKLLPGGE